MYARAASAGPCYIQVEFASERPLRCVGQQASRFRGKLGMSVEKQHPQATRGRQRKHADAERPRSGRRAYRRPVLTRFGDVRGLTLGGSPGAGDSGNVNQERSPGRYP